MAFDKAEWKNKYKDFIKKDSQDNKCKICNGIGFFTYWDENGNEFAKECECKLNNPFEDKNAK